MSCLFWVGLAIVSHVSTISSPLVIALLVMILHAVGTTQIFMEFPNH